MIRRIFLVSFLALSAFLVSGARADVDVNVSVNLPVVQITEEPVMAVIPGTYIYFIYGHQHDFFYYGGFWWRFHHNRWYRAGHYNGPWKYRKDKSVPPHLLRLPADWRRMNVVHSGFKYQEVKKNWRQWEKQKRWEKQNGPKGNGGEKMKDQPGQDQKGKEKPGKDNKKSSKGRK